MNFPDHLVAGKVPPCRIFLDGVEQEKVVEAHLSEAWLIKFVADEDGMPLVNGDKFATERLSGVVTAEWIEE
ncbi:hypothetical protein [Sphingobium sp. UBA5915]|uniref:hypothetical protein n=1 Tax=Sphingobium sp. UBA5915 TaxID=1947530 RepID=UPI0025EE6D03|nr:hypothetical protein [Sphingobium sp. UBA5915]